MKWQMTPKENISEICEITTFPLGALSISGAIYPGVPHF